jgi:four helix bundle protein
MDEASFAFEKLEVYQKALAFVDTAYEIMKAFPPEERYCLADQFRRASVSMPLNIAEGSAGTRTEFRHYLKISRRSVRECVAIVEIARRREYIPHSDSLRLRGRVAELSRMLNGLSKSLEKRS